MHNRIGQLLELLQLTVAYGYDDDRPWAAVARLHRTGSRFVFDRAATWCTSNSIMKRCRAAAILGQISLQNPMRSPQRYTKVFVDESFALISHMLASETDELAIMAEIFGLSHLYVESTVPLVLPYATHPNEDIRYAVTHALGHFHSNPAALDALILLSADSDRDVRNWATFFIGTQSDVDLPELREALVRRLHDSFPDAREEAIAGLAKRRDERAILPLSRLLRSGSFFSHHEHDFQVLVEAEEPSEGWNADTLLDALYARFPSLLPSREP